MIKIENISFVYPDGHRAITNVSMDIQSNETVGIIGANGAGKSTLLSMLVGILLPQSGSLTIDETEVKSSTLKAIRKKVGYVFQNPDDQLFMARVHEDIIFGPRNYGYSENDAEAMADEALAALAAMHLKDRASHKLSGGEKRRVAIAAVLAMKPDILVLDEPTSFLDPQARRSVIQVLNKLPHTKIIATHDLDMVLDVCSKLIVLKDGEIFTHGDPFPLLSDQRLMESCGLELPLCLQRRAANDFMPKGHI